MKDWEKYEEVAADLLNRFASDFGLDRVEGKQVVPGESGTEWEIDVKGYRDNEGNFVLVECRRHTNSRQSQEQVGALAFRIKDTGANGGIYVSPLGFQDGAKLVANATNIFEVVLTPDSTPTDFAMHFRNMFLMGVSSHLIFSDRAECEVVRCPEPNDHVER